jgi:hypothetical protein
MIDSTMSSSMRVKPEALRIGRRPDISPASRLNARPRSFTQFPNPLPRCLNPTTKRPNYPISQFHQSLYFVPSSAVPSKVV